MAWASVCLSVRLSVTLLYFIKKVQTKITKSSLWAATRTLVLWQNFVPLCEGVPIERGRQRGVPPKTLFCNWLV